MDLDFSNTKKAEEPPQHTEKELRLMKEISSLKARLKDERKKVADTDFYKKTETLEELGRVKFKSRKNLRGHLTKVIDLQWARDSYKMVSAAQDGKLIIWDTPTASKLHMICLETAWVMACAYSPSHNFVASGGLDNKVSIFNVNSADYRNTATLNGHNGYVSCLRYLNDDSQLLSCSGDKTCARWDVETGRMVQQFFGHECDVSAMATTRRDYEIFVSVSSDKICRLWDMRIGKCVQYFEGHELEICDATFFPESSWAFVSSSDDGSCRLWDLRADQAIAVYVDEYVSSTCTSVALSKSGRLLFGGYDDFNGHIWDLLREERVSILSAHDNRVAALMISDDGRAIATGSWDTTCIIWTGKY